MAAASVACLGCCRGTADDSGVGGAEGECGAAASADDEATTTRVGVAGALEQHGPCPHRSCGAN